LIPASARRPSMKSTWSLVSCGAPVRTAACSSSRSCTICFGVANFSDPGRWNADRPFCSLNSRGRSLVSSRPTTVTALSSALSASPSSSGRTCSGASPRFAGSACEIAKIRSERVQSARFFPTCHSAWSITFSSDHDSGAPLRALEHVPRHPRQSHLQLRRGLTLPPVELLLPRLAVVRLRPPRLERGLLVDVLALQHRRLAADPLLELADHFHAALRHLLTPRREHLHDLDRHTDQLALAVAVPPRA